MCRLQTVGSQSVLMTKGDLVESRYPVVIYKFFHLYHCCYHHYLFLLID